MQHQRHAGIDRARRDVDDLAVAHTPSSQALPPLMQLKTPRVLIAITRSIHRRDVEAPAFEGRKQGGIGHRNISRPERPRPCLRPSSQAAMSGASVFIPIAFASVRLDRSDRRRRVENIRQADACAFPCAASARALPPRSLTPRPSRLPFFRLLPSTLSLPVHPFIPASIQQAGKQAKNPRGGEPSVEPYARARTVPAGRSPIWSVEGRRYWVLSIKPDDPPAGPGHG